MTNCRWLCQWSEKGARKKEALKLEQKVKFKTNEEEEEGQENRR